MNSHDQHSRKVDPDPGDSDDPDDTLATQAPSRDEAAQVRAWRIERLTAMIEPHAWGPDTAEYAADLAESLADARADDGFPVDLHRFEKLVTAGCDPDIAAGLLVAL